MKAPNPIRDMMAPESFYNGLDAGIRFPVRVLHAALFETQQSCQGGKGHAYELPTVDLRATGRDARGFGALHRLEEHGLSVFRLSIVWDVKDGLPYEKLWRIEFRETFEARADEAPMFVHGYRCTA